MTELFEVLDDGHGCPRSVGRQRSSRSDRTVRSVSDRGMRPLGDHAIWLAPGDASMVLERPLGADRRSDRSPVIVVSGDDSAADRWSSHAQRHLEVDPTTGEVRVGGRIVPTSPLESEVLRVLAGRPGRVITRGEIIGTVWRDAPERKGGNLDNVLLRLRRKLEIDPADPHHIVTVWGKGLVLQADGP